MKFLELLPTKACNQNCYYCNVYNKTKYKNNDNIEIDIDYLKYILDCHKFDLYLELSGGEPGLIVNLDDAYKTLYECNRVKKIRIMSNGLIRRHGYDWLDKIEYYEHSIFDIDGTNIIQFYPDMQIDTKYLNVIITTPIMVESCLNNFKYFKSNTDIFNRHKFWLKILNPKTITALDYADKIIELYTKLDRIDEISSLIDNNDKKRKLCSKFPYLPAVDMEEQQYLHCGAYGMVCKRTNLTVTNVNKNKIGKLFSFESYCKNCYIYNNIPLETLFESCVDGYITR